MIAWWQALRAMALLRRLVIAVEGINDQIRYHNERAFPPNRAQRDPARPPAIISGRTRKTGN